MGAHDFVMVALVNGEPEQLTLLEVIDHYLDHQRAVRSGSRDSVDAAIRRDLERIAGKKAGRRRTKLPGA
ncbi:MAG: hypothetical protein PGN13_05385 [Patulibacter minatonensis]